MPFGPPTQDVFLGVFGALNRKAFEVVLRSGATLLCARLTMVGNHIAIDGKTSRRSLDRRQGKSALHAVSAYATSAGLVLGATPTREVQRYYCDSGATRPARPSPGHFTTRSATLSTSSQRSSRLNERAGKKYGGSLSRVANTLSKTQTCKRICGLRLDPNLRTKVSDPACVLPTTPLAAALHRKCFAVTS